MPVFEEILRQFFVVPFHFVFVLKKTVEKKFLFYTTKSFSSKFLVTLFPLLQRKENLQVCKLKHTRHTKENSVSINRCLFIKSHHKSNLFSCYKNLLPKVNYKIRVEVFKILQRSVCIIFILSITVNLMQQKPVKTSFNLIFLF